MPSQGTASENIPQENAAAKTPVAAPVDCALPCWLQVAKGFFFGTITPQDKRRGLEVERALSVVRAFSILGMIVTFAYGLAEGGLRGAFVAALGGAGAFSLGGMLGFLFGLPRWTDTTIVATGATDKNPRLDDDQPEKPAAAIAAASRSVRPNTNLERIMDWLTTLIVGLGLVHWEGAMKLGTETSAWFTAAISASDAARMAKNGSPGAAILLAFVTAGFVLVYLWSQRYMGEEMARADRDSRLVEDLKEQLKEQKDQVAESLKRQNEMAVIATPTAEEAQGTEERFETSQLSAAAKRLGFPRELTSDVRRRYAEDSEWDDEPMQDFGPSARGNLRLTATVAEPRPGVPVYKVLLEVSGVPASSADGCYVAFFLHHTLPQCIRAVKPIEGRAAIEVTCAGSFIAGAAVVEGDIRLSLDLAKLPGVPKDFRDN